MSKKKKPEQKPVDAGKAFKKTGAYLKPSVVGNNERLNDGHGSKYRSKLRARQNVPE